MFKRKSNSPTVSPLPPPTIKPSSTFQQQQQQQQPPSPPPPPPPPPPSGQQYQPPPQSRSFVEAYPNPNPNLSGNGHSYMYHPSPASLQRQLIPNETSGPTDVGGPLSGPLPAPGRPVMQTTTAPQGSPASSSLNSGSYSNSTTPTQRGSPAQSVLGTNGHPMVVGPPAERTISAMSNGSTSKQDKRKSFFGLLGQRKDKEDKKETPRPKSQLTSAPFQQHQRQVQPQQQQQQILQQQPQSLSQAPPQQQYPNSFTPATGGGNGGFQPYTMRQFPPPEKGRTLPPPQAGSPITNQNQQQQLSNSNQDLGPNPNFKSHTIGVASRNSTLPDRSPFPDKANGNGSLNDTGRNTMPRSTSMPINSNPNSPSSHTGAGAGGNQQAPPLMRDTPFSTDQNLNADGRSTWMNDFDPIVELISLQPHKTYIASPPELEMILARTSAGQQPKQGPPGSPNNDWDSVWLQLSGTSLSTWSMKETRAAAARGEKVPPTYYNITDSSLELLAALPPPPHRPNSHPHRYVFSLNTAGSNRLLFSAPSERDLSAWTTALRLASWERARLEEIYTGHLIRSAGREPRSLLVRGRMEGWVRVRVMGGTDWRRLWAVLNTPEQEEGNKEDEKKSRRRSFFGIGDKQPEQVQEPNTGLPMASFYVEPRTTKNKTVPPVLTITSVTQAYAVFPERMEVISASNLMKLVGRIGGDMVTIEGRLRDSGWALIMPDTSNEGGNSTTSPTPLVNMMRWVTAFHDVFKLYGRPERYNWDEKDPTSLFFAYPRGSQRSSLFLTNDEAMMSDFRTPSLASVRRQFTGIVLRRLQGMAPVTEHENEHDQDRDHYRETAALREEEDGSNSTRPTNGNYRLPPLSFDSHADTTPEPRSLTPITERTDIASRTNSTRTASSRLLMDFPQAQTGSGGAGSGSGSGGASGRDGTDRGSISALSSGSKQGSRDSNKAGHNEDRLEPISDTETFGGLYTDEPVAVITTNDRNHGRYAAYAENGAGSAPTDDCQLTPVLPTPSSAGGDVLGGPGPSKSTASTIWSQSSAPTPDGSNHDHSSGETHREANNKTPTPVSPPGPPVRAAVVSPASAPAPPTRDASPSQVVPHSSTRNERRQSLPLVPIPVAIGQAEGQQYTLSTVRPPQTPASIKATPLIPTTTAPAAPLTSSAPQPMLAQHQASQGTENQLATQPVLSQVPRRVSSKEDIQAGINDKPEPTPMAVPTSPTPANSADRVRPTIITSMDGSGRTPAPAITYDNTAGTGALGRKPSGARPPNQQLRRSFGSVPMKSTSESIEAEDTGMFVPAAAAAGAAGAAMTTAAANGADINGHGQGLTEGNDFESNDFEDASAYLAYADQVSPSKNVHTVPASIEGDVKLTPPVAVNTATAASPPASGTNAGTGQSQAPPQPSEARSSFAPSKAAAERRAKAEQAEAQRQRAMALPGGGKRVPEASAATASGSGGPVVVNKEDLWSGSDEDEDEDDEDVTSPIATMGSMGFNSAGLRPQGGDVDVKRSSSRALPPLPTRSGSTVQNGIEGLTGDKPGIGGLRASSPQMLVDNQARYPSYNSGSGVPPSNQQYPQLHSTGSSKHQPVPYPPITSSNDTTSTGGNRGVPPRQSQFYTDQQSMPPPPHTHPSHRSQPQPQPDNPRSTIWNANFAIEHGMPDMNRSGKFVELEEPSAQLTKAFAPHGLLQAGIQDKEDRSARKQEEIARETGSSLINVPAKPPPPQAGLLGAVAAHERDRKNPGGIGATLTDRDRERRLAEDRQRKIEELQRQQMEHMSQYGMFSNPNPYSSYPYMSSPYSPYGMNMNMGMGYNPAHAQQQAMYAAQMAYQQAYSQALMAMSAAGSQVGTPGEEGGAGNGRSGSPVGSVHGPHSSLPPPAQYSHQANPYFPHPSPFMSPQSHPMSMYGFPQQFPTTQPHSPYGGMSPSPSGFFLPGAGGVGSGLPGTQTSSTSIPLPSSPSSHPAAAFGGVGASWNGGAPSMAETANPAQYRGSVHDLNAQTTESRASSDRLRDDERLAS